MIGFVFAEITAASKGRLTDYRGLDGSVAGGHLPRCTSGWVGH